MSVPLSDFIETSAKATRTDEVFQCLCTAVSSQNCNRVAFFALTAQAQRAMTPSRSDLTPLLASNYPEDYLCRYLQKQRYEIDPVLLLARQSLTPLVWEDVVDGMTLSEEQKLLSVERRKAGIYGEVTCPVHGPREQTFAVCFAHNSPGQCDRSHLSALQVLAIHFYYAFARVCQSGAQSVDTPIGLADNPPIGLSAARVLTHRERECLLWTARGKSASTISIILGLSENTINFYVKNAMRKLGTTNRVVAVVLAVRSGLIQP